MSKHWNRLRVPGWIVYCIIASAALCTPNGAFAQLPSPAADAAEELLQIVRSGNEERLRAFIDERFAPDLRDIVPMREHLRVFALFRRDLEGRETTGVELRGPTEVSLFLTGPADRLELRLHVASEPPHRVTDLNVSDAGPEIDAGSLDELDTALRRLAARDEFSGVVLIATGGEVRFHQAYGFADRGTKRSNRPGTRFDIGSLSKLFTSTAILRLVQEGRLDLADPLGTYLEGFEPEVAGRVTVQHLLRHSSGFGDYLSHPEFAADPKRFDEPAAFLPLAREQELAFDPGTDVRYSNLGFVLLGMIVEDVTGRGYHEIVEDLVFDPAGMATASPTGGEAAARRYHRVDDGFVAVDSLYPNVGSPAGGGFAAALDLLRFIEALLDNELLSEKHTALLLNNFDAEAEGLPQEIGFAGGADGVNAIVRARPADRQVVVILTNIDDINLSAIARSLLALDVAGVSVR